MRYAVGIVFLAAVVALAQEDEKPSKEQTDELLELPRGFALIVCGVSGDEAHYEKFWSLASDLYHALRDRCGYPEDRIFLLFENKPPAQQIVHATSSKADIMKTFEELKNKLRPNDKLLIFLAGHADFEDQKHARYHLPGPDISDEEIGKLIDSLPTKRITTIVTMPCSGYFLRHISKPGRITITATKPAAELSETVFPYCFVKAFEDETADQNADGLLSVLELFRYTREKVLDFYLEKNLIATEHAMLDDDGDGIGVREVDEHTTDGRLAEKEYFEIRVKG